jgi:hypothetical protein
MVLLPASDITKERVLQAHASAVCGPQPVLCWRRLISQQKQRLVGNRHCLAILLLSLPALPMLPVILVHRVTMLLLNRTSRRQLLMGRYAAWPMVKTDPMAYTGIPHHWHFQIAVSIQATIGWM